MRVCAYVGGCVQAVARGEAITMSQMDGEFVKRGVKKQKEKPHSSLLTSALSSITGQLWRRKKINDVNMQLATILADCTKSTQVGWIVYPKRSKAICFHILKCQS